MVFGRSAEAYPLRPQAMHGERLARNASLLYKIWSILSQKLRPHLDTCEWNLNVALMEKYIEDAYEILGVYATRTGSFRFENVELDVVFSWLSDEHQEKMSGG